MECSQRGLKLTSPGFKSKDEGFESDCESIRSIKMTESVELDLADLMDHLEISKEEKETDSGTLILSSLSSGVSMDNTSISSSSNLHVSDDSNSSSGNGSDSDEFCANTSGERSPYWETLPNLSSFQSYPIEDLVFCHCDALHPSILVWVVRHLAKMMALVTAFRTRAEAEELFQRYRDLRLTVKPVKHKMNPILGTKIPIPIPPVPTSPAPNPPSSSSEVESHSFSSLPSAYPTEILHETQQSKSQLFSREPKSLDFDFSSIYSPGNSSKDESSKEGPSPYSGGTIPRFYNPFPHQHLYVNTKAPKVPENSFAFRSETSNETLTTSNNNSNNNEAESDEDSDGEDYPRHHRLPARPHRKLQLGFGKSSKSGSNKPVLLVPLKNESVTTAKSSYPKEAYLYHVMGRTSSTFAPYQRSLNFIPPYAMANGSNSGTEYLAWANSNGRHLLVPFSSWLELSEMNKGAHGTTGIPTSRNMVHMTPKSSSRRGGSKTSTLTHLSGKGTAKILLRDSAGHHNGMWATLSQRFKRNFRETLMPKLNGMWTQPETGKLKKKPNKKVTFNAWATVQMV